jgi:PAS domain S-box-containing protein
VHRVECLYDVAAACEQTGAVTQHAARLDRAEVLAAAIDEAPVCVFVADEEMRYVAVNAYACKLLGFSEDELLTMRVSDVASYPEAPREYETMRKTAYLRGVSRVHCKDGDVVSLHYVAGEVEVAGERLYISIGQPDFELGC